MANVNTAALGQDILNAMRGALSGHWQAARPYVETEARKLAETAAFIARGRVNGDINDAQAKILVQMQANASQAVLTAVETIGMIAAQDAINAALNVLRTAVNSAVGVALL